MSSFWFELAQLDIQEEPHKPVGFVAIFEEERNVEVEEYFEEWVEIVAVELVLAHSYFGEQKKAKYQPFL